MALLPPAPREQARAFARLHLVNPFTEARTEVEELALGDAYVRPRRRWTHGDVDAQNPNLEALERTARELLGRMRRELDKGARPTREEAELYRELAILCLYDESALRLDELLEADARKKVSFYREVEKSYRHFFDVEEALRPSESCAHLFALFFQLRRAFHHVHRFLLGASAPAARLRASVWESIFTWDPGRYRKSLHARMSDVTTLITGPSGTGKELVARAIGLSRYVPFDEGRLVFRGDFREAFVPLHLSALTSTLVESELFGHKKGAFTGALEDRKGWLSSCPPEGTVFLDEIGELEPSLQVKLLRVLESRELSPLGSTVRERFLGRIVAATHRDLHAEMRKGAFREDLYYRLCSDLIETPSLKARLDDDPTELERLARAIATDLVGAEEAERLTLDVLRATRELGPDYPWPGNVRELGQCVRNVLVRGRYRPPTTSGASSWLEAARTGSLSVDELVSAYVRHVHAEVGTYEGTARRLGLDRRTVRARVEAGASPDGGRKMSV